MLASIDYDAYGIPIAGLLFAILLLWFIIGTKGNWIAKVGITVFTLYFTVCTWSALNSLLGWPSPESPANKKIQILWVEAEEPNKKTGQPGSIYVWLKYLEPNKNSNSSFIVQLHHKEVGHEPRVHKIPYSRKMHEQAMSIKEQIAKGKPFFGEIKESEIEAQATNQQGNQGNGQGQGNGGSNKSPDGNGKQGKGDGGSLSQDQEFMFYELPPAIFQDKNAP